MKTLKTLKYVLVFAAIFSFAGCELVPEPDFGSETGEDQAKYEDLD